MVCVFIPKRSFVESFLRLSRVCLGKLVRPQCPREVTSKEKASPSSVRPPPRGQRPAHRNESSSDSVQSALCTSAHHAAAAERNVKQREARSVTYEEEATQFFLPLVQMNAQRSDELCPVVCDGWVYCCSSVHYLLAKWLTQSTHVPAGSQTAFVRVALTGAEAASVMGATSISSPNMYCSAQRRPLFESLSKLSLLPLFT